MCATGTEAIGRNTRARLQGDANIAFERTAFNNAVRLLNTGGSRFRAEGDDQVDELRAVEGSFGTPDSDRASGFDQVLAKTGGSRGGVARLFDSGELKTIVSGPRTPAPTRVQTVSRADAPPTRDVGRSREAASRTSQAQRTFEAEDRSLEIKRRGKKAITNRAGLGIGGVSTPGSSAGLNIPS